MSALNLKQLETDLRDLARTVGQRLGDAGLTCATAESCTGGLVGHLFTEIAGSSAWFVGGAIVYSYEAKERVLGVSHETLMKLGAVSAEVAAQMAAGARQLYEVDMAVSITGVAGPGGGSAEKPVGTVYLHLSAEDVEQGAHFVWDADRRGNKLLSAKAALEMIDKHVVRGA